MITILLLSLLLPYVLGTAERPPMGWNSWDSFDSSGTEGSPTEAEFNTISAAFSKFLAPHGYEYLVVDAGWYEFNSSVMNTDGYSRLIPSTNLWPSSANGNGFKTVTANVHSLGLKFGFHVMRGIHKSVVDANEPIYGTQYHAKDIAVQSDACPWWTDWYGVNMSHPAAVPYYQSLIDLYASWGADFIKVDCIFAVNYHEQDIIAISNGITNNGREILFSLSPGAAATPAQASQINQYVNTYRITQDFWDCWTTGPGVCGWCSNVLTHFTIVPEFSSLIGAQGRNGSSWPDADMLPLGYIIDPGTNSEAYTRFTPDEQMTVMTLWSMFRSPLIFGGDVTKLDQQTLNVIANDEVIAIQQSSSGNSLSQVNSSLYIAQADGESGVKYAAIFNSAETNLTTSLRFEYVGVSGTCQVRDLWAHADLGTFTDAIPTIVPIHGTRLYSISNCS